MTLHGLDCKRTTDSRGGKNCFFRVKSKDDSFRDSYLNCLTSKPKSITGKTCELRLKLLDQPPYPPDLAPSVFLFFSQLKIMHGGQRFASDIEVTIIFQRKTPSSNYW
ncbi:unnamed protein product [Ceratitis capitata]|uniref:(Mediterranean fruit fly) hypothetical protein n=1 Tax=Ceratitis capitata TaxID=7213 RepID=A0A811V7S3_CERCA|nr:unnamed protein product [Ceratitis capitata]